MITTVQELLEQLYKNGKRGDIVYVDISASAQEAASVMQDNKINLVAVRSRGRYVGVVSSSDTSGEFASTGMRPSEKGVAHIMAKKVITVGLKDEVNGLAKFFTDNSIRHLIVVDKKKGWLAVLSTNEVLKAVMGNINEQDQREAYARGEVLGRT